MFGNILSGLTSGLLGSFAAPVQILDAESFGVVFSSAHPMHVSVSEDKKMTEFTIESGEQRSDHVIDKATEIKIMFMLVDANSRNQFENMRQIFKENKLVTIQTRMTTYSNFLIESFPHDETADMSVGATLEVRFKEWKEVQPEYGELQQKEVATKPQASTQQRGRQTGATVQEEQKKKGSLLSDIYTSAKGG